MIGNLKYPRIGKLFLLSFTLVLIPLSHNWGNDYVPPMLLKILEQNHFPYQSGESFPIKNDQLLSVQFTGATKKSRYGVGQRGSEYIRGGVWLNMNNWGEESWSNASINLKQPLDLRRFNAVLLWVKPHQNNIKFWFGLNDARWDIPSSFQSRTEILKLGSKGAGAVIPLIVPFGAIFPETPMDYSQIKRISLEFGTDTAGNYSGTSFQIMGIAFVTQDITRETPYMLSNVDLTITLQSDVPKMVETKKKSLQSFMKGMHIKMWSMDIQKKVFFVPKGKGVSVFESPVTTSRSLGELTKGLAYTSIHSGFVGNERWHCILIDNKKKGWVKDSQLRQHNFK